ncbi:MAG: carboxypeptidase-like regulatory domain-containing protein [Flavobacteriaceae bacterium]
MTLEKGTITLLLILASLTPIQAQHDFKGMVIDAKTGNPIPYVNIGIVEKGIGTVSDEDGLFHLYFDKAQMDPTDQVLFSSLGYRSLKIPVSSLPLAHNEYTTYKMEPHTTALSEVVVTNKKGRFIPDFIGYRNFGEETFGYWKNNMALGGELATHIVAKSGLRRLDSLQFEVFHNPSDSLLLRVNVYDGDGRMGGPGTNLNTSGKNILLTLGRMDKVVWVNLRPFDIYVKNNFMVSLELVKVYGEGELGLVLAGAMNQYGSYRKYVSQGKWERIANQNMAYSLKTSLMVSEKMASRYETKKARKKQKLRTVSGFAIMKGHMVSKVEVRNNRTKEIVWTDEKGRYRIAANKGDLLLFSKEGLKTMAVKVTHKPTANVVMKASLSP